MNTNMMNMILVYDERGSDVAVRALSKIYEYSAKGFKRFNIIVISNLPKPIYLDKLKDLVRNVVAFTLFIKYYGSSPKELGELATMIRDKPHLAIIESSLSDYINVARKCGLNFETV